jgi:hypothetical protein
MAVRTKELDVKDLLGDNYGAKRDGTFPALKGFVLTANSVVNQVLVCAARKSIAVSSADQELMERLLAAHMYMMSDKAYQSRSTAGRSGSFQGQTGMRLESTDYGQSAMVMDPSGCLENINKRQKAGGAWLGKTNAEALTYDQRMGECPPSN